MNVRLDTPTDVDQPFERVLRLDVIDQGVGIKEEDLDRIFDPYVRAASTKGGGTGLGLHSALCLSSHAPPHFHPSLSVYLAVARSFARVLGGGISVASAIGFGSTFTLTVPLRVLSDAEAAQPRSPPVTVVVPSNAVPSLPGAPAIGGGAASGRSSCSSYRAEEPPSPADYVCEPVATPRTPADDEVAMRVLADVIGNARDGATSSFRVVVFFHILICRCPPPVFVFALEPGAGRHAEPSTMSHRASPRVPQAFSHDSHFFLHKVFASPSVSNILGWKPEELVGRLCECLLADEAGEALNTVEECPAGATRVFSESASASTAPPGRPRPTRITRQLAASDGTMRWLARDVILQECRALLTSPCFVRSLFYCDRTASSSAKATGLCL